MQFHDDAISREKLEKINVTWNDNGTVTYRRMRKWYFDPEGSNGTLDDPITTINVVAVVNFKFFFMVIMMCFRGREF